MRGRLGGAHRMTTPPYPSDPRGSVPTRPEGRGGYASPGPRRPSPALRAGCRPRRPPSSQRQLPSTTPEALHASFKAPASPAWAWLSRCRGSGTLFLWRVAGSGARFGPWWRCPGDRSGAKPMAARMAQQMTVTRLPQPATRGALDLRTTNDGFILTEPKARMVLRACCGALDPRPRWCSGLEVPAGSVAGVLLTRPTGGVRRVLRSLRVGASSVRPGSWSPPIEGRLF